MTDKIIKNKLYIFFFGILFMVSFYSCRKCMNCSYTYYENGKKVVFSSQECGSSKDIDEYKARMDSAAAYFDTVAYCN